MQATQIWIHPGPQTPTWTHVVELTLGILMSLYCYKFKNPDNALSSSMGLDHTIAPRDRAVATHIYMAPGGVWATVSYKANDSSTDPVPLYWP